MIAIIKNPLLQIMTLWCFQGGGGGGGGGGGYGRPPAASTGWRLTAENLSSNTSWQDLKDFARTGGKVLESCMCLSNFCITFLKPVVGAGSLHRRAQRAWRKGWSDRICH
jgi:hypothetical protein